MSTNTPVVAVNRHGMTLTVVYEPKSITAPRDTYFVDPDGTSTCHIPQRHRGASWQTTDMVPVAVRSLEPEECPFPLPETWRGRL